VTRSLIAVGLVAAGALLGAATTAELNEARPLLGPMAVDVSRFLNRAALALAVTLVCGLGRLPERHVLGVIAITHSPVIG
jgi:hypothetical protein